VTEFLNPTRVGSGFACCVDLADENALINSFLP
jgi:hypothetical protein